MKKTVIASFIIFLMLAAVHVGTGNAGAPLQTDVPVQIIRSCERQDDISCVTKKFEEALLESNSLGAEDRLTILYELAARYEYYQGDLRKARKMYLEIEKIDPDYGLTQQCIKKLNRKISGLAKR